MGLKARSLVFLAAMEPMAVWLLSDGRLARPWEVMVWALWCAVLAAAPTGRFLRIPLCAMWLLLPWTVYWMGAVVLTGTGPSMASLDAVMAGSISEVLTASGAAVREPAFVLVVVVHLVLLALALRAVHRPPGVPVPGWVFLLALLPCFVLVLDSAGVNSVSRLAGPEARSSVSWLSLLEASKESLALTVDKLATGQGQDSRRGLSASNVRPTFRADPGLGVFIVGESLRADSLTWPGRGAASAELEKRLQEGLGVRLPDACAGGNSTFVSVPKLVTLSESPVPSHAFGKPSLLALAKAAGARTAYITNHETWVFPELGHDLLLKTSSQTANTIDEVAIEAMGDFVRRSKAPSKAVLLHLYGQHFNYEDRYPFSLFEPEPQGLTAPALMALRYQRAAEYGTEVLLKAAAVLDEQTTPAFLVFTSDHGENLPSDDTGKRLHAGPSNGRHDTVVPVLVLWNRAFADAKRAERLAPLMKATDLIAHRDVARAWLSLMGDTAPLEATVHPVTWGAAQAGEPIGPLSCAALGP